MPHLWNIDSGSPWVSQDTVSKSVEKTLKATLTVMHQHHIDWVTRGSLKKPPHCYLHISWEMGQGRGFQRGPTLTDIKLWWLVARWVRQLWGEVFGPASCNGRKTTYLNGASSESPWWWLCNLHRCPYQVSESSPVHSFSSSASYPSPRELLGALYILSWGKYPTPFFSRGFHGADHLRVSLPSHSVNSWPLCCTSYDFLPLAQRLLAFRCVFMLPIVWQVPEELLARMLWGGRVSAFTGGVVEEDRPSSELGSSPDQSRSLGIHLLLLAPPLEKGSPLSHPLQPPSSIPIPAGSRLDVSRLLISFHALIGISVSL